ncbi:MAG: aspartate ammonia-lyase [Oscillospiraceae bacterium]|nr:aspartate ammonia-lyase [Oscillospiraceae bacterium]
MSYRIESDSIGSKKVPADAYYGVQSLRGRENFQITGQRLRPEFIDSLAEIKKTCAISNHAVEELDGKIKEAICVACDEILEGKFHDQFICDPIQGGAGTTANMNANEVIANRAIEILGGTKGDYSIVHPNDHVNRAQSTNDVIPTAAKMTAAKLLKKALFELERLNDALMVKAKEFHNVIKMGRTQMQDAVPIRLGSEFGAYSRAISRDILRIKRAMVEMYAINLGGTAIGTALNAHPEYVDLLAPTLSRISNLPLTRAHDLVDGTQNLDSFAYVSAALKTCAISCSKMANDFRLMSSGPRCGFEEINLPAMQNGSSIMPGKVNPVIPEVMSQAAFCIIGNDMTITMAAEAGQLELNYAEPVLYHKLFESIVALTGAVQTLTDNCVVGITANEERCRELVEGSVGVITAICPKVGYAESADIAKTAIKTGESVREVLKSKNIFSEEEIEKILDPQTMV